MALRAAFLQEGKNVGVVAQIVARDNLLWRSLSNDLVRRNSHRDAQHEHGYLPIHTQLLHYLPHSFHHLGTAFYLPYSNASTLPIINHSQCQGLLLSDTAAGNTGSDTFTSMQRQ